MHPFDDAHLEELGVCDDLETEAKCVPKSHGPSIGWKIHNLDWLPMSTPCGKEVEGEIPCNWVKSGTRERRVFTLSGPLLCKVVRYRCSNHGYTLKINFPGYPINRLPIFTLPCSLVMAPKKTFFLLNGCIPPKKERKRLRVSDSPPRVMLPPEQAPDAQSRAWRPRKSPRSAAERIQYLHLQGFVFQY